MLRSFSGASDRASTSFPRSGVGTRGKLASPKKSLKSATSKLASEGAPPCALARQLLGEAAPGGFTRSRFVLTGSAAAQRLCGAAVDGMRAPAGR
jgi:hypothetical protein